MRLFHIVFIIIICKILCFSQDIVSHEFTGFLTTTDGLKLSFKLVLNDIEDGDFSGYSATDFDGDNYTKSVVEGNISLKKNKMSFKEISNTETKSSIEESNFCYITASNLIIKKLKDKNLVVGKFKGVYPSGKTCATGAVALINKDTLEHILIKKTKPVESKSIDAEKKPTVSDSVFTSDEELVIKDWEENGVFIEVWDGGVQDSDLIAIYLDNELIREKVFLTNKKTIIKLPTDKEKFQLKIVALNEGHSGINTLHFRLKNAGKEKDYISELNKGESFVIDFGGE